jgi:subtilisin family serine protease
MTDRKEEIRSPSRRYSPDLLHRLASGKGLLILAAVSVVLILLAVAGTLVFISSKQNNPSIASPPPSLEDLATQYPKISRLLQDEKLDSVYKQFLITFQEGGIDAAYDLAKKRGILNAQNQVRMTLELDTEDTQAIQASLEEHGIQVTAASKNIIDISIPAAVLQASLESDTPGAVFMEISGLEHIVRIRLPIQAIQDVGSVDTESVPVIGADVWQEAGFTGKGVKIGVLDVGFDKYRELLGTDLPQNVLTRSFIEGVEIDQTGIEHGSAVAEIIHDIAPDAELVFAAYQTAAEKQSAVDWLVSLNPDIISSSTGSTFGRRDNKSFLARMVDEVVAQGILWVNSSGNTGISHYRAKFTDANGDGYHEFEPDSQYMGFVPIGGATLALNWNDWDAGIQDLDLYVYDQNGNEIASSTDRQTGAGSDAGEFMYYEFTDEGPYYVSFYAVNVTRPLTLDFFLRDGELEYYTPEYSVNTPGDSTGALTVGAVDWESGDLEDYSSRGPTEDGRTKPDLVAPAGVSSAAYGDTWIGTSASCPHVTGAAALILQAFPDYSPQQVKDFLFGRAVDMDRSGEDSNTGYGALFLGDPPDLTQNQPVPTPTEVAVLVEPTATKAPKATSAPKPTATSAFEEPPKKPAGKSTSSLTTLILLGCVVLPGFLGLGGFGLLGVVLLRRRSGGKAQATPVAKVDWAAPIPPVMPPTPPAPPVREEAKADIVCPNCGKRSRPDTRFCSNCGIEIRPQAVPEAGRAHFCRNCGNPLRNDAKFCPKCGTLVERK